MSLVSARAERTTCHTSHTSWHITHLTASFVGVRITPRSCQANHITHHQSALNSLVYGMRHTSPKCTQLMSVRNAPHITKVHSTHECAECTTHHTLHFSCIAHHHTMSLMNECAGVETHTLSQVTSHYHKSQVTRHKSLSHVTRHKLHITSHYHKSHPTR